MQEKSLDRIVGNIRLEILKMNYQAQDGHTGGSLSCVEILTALYFKVLKISSTNSDKKSIDRFIFSKGHDAKALYATLAERGYFPKKLLDMYQKNGSFLAGHPTKSSVAGVEVSTGSLGHGLSIGAGMAFVRKKGAKRGRIYVLLSDGECDEGSVWEATLFSAQHRLDNLVAIIDYNKLQGFGYTKDVLDLEPFGAKWESFGWGVLEVDGHDLAKLLEAFSKVPFETGKPSVLICHTIKGFGGISKYVNQVSSQYAAVNKEDYEELIRKIEK